MLQQSQARSIPAGRPPWPPAAKRGDLVHRFEPEDPGFEIAGYTLRATRQIVFRSNCLFPRFLLHWENIFWSSDFVFDEKQYLAAALSRISPFSELPPETVSRLIGATQRQSLKKGDTLIRRGDTSETLYFVLRGRFLVSNPSGIIAEIGTGEPVGELAFFAGGKRTADVVAARNSEVWCLTRSAYDTIARDIPDLPNTILASLAQRLSNSTGSSVQLRPQPGQVVTVMPAGNTVLPESIERELRLVFANRSDWTIISGRDIPESVQENPQVWLQEQESARGHLLLICEDPAKNPIWFSAVSENCDTIFSFAPLTTDTPDARALSPFEEAVLKSSHNVNSHLVFYRDEKAQTISGSARWLESRPVGLHHHIAFDDEPSFERLSRFIRGKALGLVMSGGGAFGTAHLGAIKALQERGFTFDMVGGTSIGSAMSAVLAMEMDPLEAIEICQDMFLKNKAMGRFTFPMYSVIDHHRLDEQLRKHYGALKVEDMPISFFAIAANLSNNDIYPVRSGPLWKAVRASCSLPGIFPPVITDQGDVLIDGGLLDNVPIAQMRQYKAGPNLIFNFDLSGEWRVRAKYEDLPGRWGALARLLKLKKVAKPRFPTVFSVLSRSMVVSARRLMEQTDISGDIMIELKTLRGMGFLEWRKGKRQFDEAYRQMTETLDLLGVDGTNADDDVRIAQLSAVAGHISASAGPA